MSLVAAVPAGGGSKGGTGERTRRRRHLPFFYKLSFANKILVSTLALLGVLGVTGTVVFQLVLRSRLYDEVAVSTQMLAASTAQRAAGLLASQDELIDRVARPAGLLNAGHGRQLRRNEGPVRLIIRAGRHPLPQDFLLLICQRSIRFRGRHDFVLIAREDSPHQLTVPSVAGDNRRITRIGRCQRQLANVQPKAPLASLLVRAMAFEAVTREDRPHVAIEIGRRGLGCRNQQHENR